MIGFEFIRMSLGNLKYHKIRTALTLLGIIIGIAAIFSILSLGEGLNQAIQNEFESFGLDSLFISSATLSQTGGGDSGAGGSANAAALRDSDIDFMNSLPNVKSVTPISSAYVPVEFKGQTRNINFFGFDAEEIKPLEDTGSVKLLEGRQLTTTDTFSVVIGEKVANDFFDSEIKLRNNVRINGKDYRVVGIMKESSQSFGGGPSFGSVVFITKKAMRQELHVDTIAFAFVRVTSTEEVDAVQARITKRLEDKYGEKSFNVSTSEEAIKSIQSVLGIISVFLLGIAGISLLVGGVGIMNSMFTTVLERTREIGVMKAIGAKNSTVLLLFLIEAGFVGLIGGLFGILIGYGIASLVSVIAISAGFKLYPFISAELLFGVLIFSMLVGMVSGFIPARQASQMDPVEALRYE